MRGVNKVIVIGNLGKDPEIRYSQAGNAMTTCSVATQEVWNDKQGNKQERTEWHRVKFFGKLAEIAGEYLKKGGQVYIEGSLRTEKYTDKAGVERYSTDIIANEMQMLGGNPANRSGGDSGGGQRSERPSGASSSAQTGSSPSSYGGGGGGSPDAFPDGPGPGPGLDDIPFARLHSLW